MQPFARAHLPLFAAALGTVTVRSPKQERSLAEIAHSRKENGNAPLFNNHVRNDPFKDGRIDDVGGYVQGDMRFGALNLLAGLRRDTVKGSAASMNNGAITTGLDRGDRDHTLKQLAELMNKCIACHAAYTVLPPGDAP